MQLLLRVLSWLLLSSRRSEIPLGLPIFLFGAIFGIELYLLELIGQSIFDLADI